MSQLSFSILIPTCNRAVMMGRLLASIKAQTRLPSEIVVIDQSDGDDTREFFEKWECQGVSKKYIKRTVKSLILARNVGIDACGNYDLIAFLDDDVDLRPNFCEELVKVFEVDQSRVYAGGMGTIQGTKYRFKPLQRLFFMPREGKGNFLPGGSPTLCHWRKDFCDVEFLSGGITFWRKDIIQTYRFDERIAGYGHGDDVDVSFRISRKYRLFYQPSASCYHDEHSPGRDRLHAYRRVWVQNMYYLAQKNGHSIPAFMWCVIGHILRDAISGNFQAVKGSLEAIRRIISGKIDTVVGYQDFIRMKRGIRES